MNRDPFLRLALIAGVTVWALLLAAAAEVLGWPAAVAAGLVGVAGALTLTVELQPSVDPLPPGGEIVPVPGEERRLRQPEQGTRRFRRIA